MKPMPATTPAPQATNKPITQPAIPVPTRKPKAVAVRIARMGKA